MPLVPLSGIRQGGMGQGSRRGYQGVRSYFLGSIGNVLTINPLGIQRSNPLPEPCLEPCRLSLRNRCPRSSLGPSASQSTLERVSARLIRPVVYRSNPRARTARGQHSIESSCSLGESLQAQRSVQSILLFSYSPILLFSYSPILLNMII